MIDPFGVSRLPELVFGAGSLARLPDLAARFGRKALLLHGASLKAGGRLDRVRAALDEKGFGVACVESSGEPTPAFVDDVARMHRGRQALVVAIGGGSVMDAGKAVAAMCAVDGRVGDFLEGVGSRAPAGDTLPLVAVPTTAGTGSEATKNAVLSEVGPKGFKRSLRHDAFVPRVALLDPELTLSCPPEVAGACGLDAFTQLLEAFVSVKAGPFTDALAWSGMELCARSLVRAGLEPDLSARSDMACAAYLSGVCLANAGLGAIHGLAGSMGGLFPIAHGLLCGGLAAPVIVANVRALRALGPAGAGALAKYARVGALLCGSDPADLDASPGLLAGKVSEWRRALGLRSLSSCGAGPQDADRIAQGAGLKENPVRLGEDELREIVRAGLAAL